MEERDQKILAFYIALTDVYRDEEDRDLSSVPAIKISDDGEMTEDIYCILRAVHMLLMKITGNDDMDLLDTIATFNRLVFKFSELSEENTRVNIDD
ncbi:MAG: hypothetical protein ACI4I1_08960 [Oscillospiraceae bacterium]